VQAAALGVIAYRLVSFWLPIPAGGIAYLTLRLDPKFRERQQQTEREREQETQDQQRREGGLRTWAGEHGVKVGPAPQAPEARSKAPDGAPEAPFEAPDRAEAGVEE
jgi:nucleoid-associated protein YgaU